MTCWTVVYGGFKALGQIMQQWHRNTCSNGIQTGEHFAEDARVRHACIHVSVCMCVCMCERYSPACLSDIACMCYGWFWFGLILTCWLLPENHFACSVILFLKHKMSIVSRRTIGISNADSSNHMDKREILQWIWDCSSSDSIPLHGSNM